MSVGKKSRMTHVLTVLVLLTTPVKLFGCAACFGRSDSNLADGMNWGIFSLLAVIIFVLGGIATFFAWLAKRSAAVTDADAAVPVRETSKQL